ncbi:hypothetical protein K502DRAFT_323417 [Neoconidiobolus thromboides FSU 785]|nr:hypothetical protein K502DRAFT_323417 [Neoconidiobolus thromboides FSU 785]
MKSIPFVTLILLNLIVAESIPSSNTFNNLNHAVDNNQIQFTDSENRISFDENHINKSNSVTKRILNNNKKDSDLLGEEEVEEEVEEKGEEEEVKKVHEKKAGLKLPGLKLSVKFTPERLEELLNGQFNLKLFGIKPAVTNLIFKTALTQFHNLQVHIVDLGLSTFYKFNSFFIDNIFSVYINIAARLTKNEKPQQHHFLERHPQLAEYLAVLLRHHSGIFNGRFGGHIRNTLAKAKKRSPQAYGKYIQHLDNVFADNPIIPSDIYNSIVHNEVGEDGGEVVHDFEDDKI